MTYLRRVGIAVAMVAAGVSSVAAQARAESPAQPLGDAFEAYDRGDLAGAKKALAALGSVETTLKNRDYVLWLRGQIELAAGNPVTARRAFAALGKLTDSRFAVAVPWRLADCDWEAGNKKAAIAAYQKLIGTSGASRHAELGAVAYRIASMAPAAQRSGALRGFLLDYPAHALSDQVARELAVVAGALPTFSPRERIARAKRMHRDHQWHEAVAELALIDTSPSGGLDEQTRDAHDLELGETLFDMRRRYGDAATLLLGAYKRLGSGGADAMFHGARALSRADHDTEAIEWYGKVVAAYPRSPEAAEAQYLSGWLEFNRGNYQAGLPALEATLANFGGSKYATDARWFLGMSHYLLGDYDKAIVRFEELAKRSRSLEGGKGQYWLARAHQMAKRVDEAKAEYREIVSRFPMSWYALLARARLVEAGDSIGIFGDKVPTPRVPTISAKIDEVAAAADPLVARVDELLAIGLGIEAGDVLESGERGVLKRFGRPDGYALLFDRYERAGNYNRPWMIAVVHSGNTLDGPADGAARVWWEHAYPEAYKPLIGKYQAAGQNPDGYLYSIMRKESGFDPHVLSYADAQGLLQMIPATTERVAGKLGLPYDPGQLYEPGFNVQTGAWYIGNLLAKFHGQIPLGAGSFNSGPRPVMRWCDQNGTRPIDEFVELVSYTQTREYMKKVTENYARYRYLYHDETYDQPLKVNPAYLVNDLTF